jgi:hypothetical protein
VAIRLPGFYHFECVNCHAVCNRYNIRLKKIILKTVFSDRLCYHKKQESC